MDTRPVHDGTFVSGGSEIEEVKTKINEVKAQISSVEEEMRNCKRYRYDCANKVCFPSCPSTFMFFSFRICNSETDKHYLRDKKKQLRDKENQLRDEEIQLRDEENLLLEWQLIICEG